jgi:6-phosphogluconolactonase (cycloisomerase 2 family)
MRSFALFLAAFVANTVSHPFTKDEKSLGFYIALQSTGIVEISFDPSQSVNNSLSITGYTTNAGFRPGWLTSYKDKIYSISRTHYLNSDDKSGGVYAFEKPPVSASAGTNLTLLDERSSNGEGGVHCDVSPDGKTLSAANIDGSSVSIFPLSKDGTIGTATNIFHYNLAEPGPGTNKSQIRANPHQTAFDPSGNFLFVPDKGSDIVYVYSVNGPEQVTHVQDITLPPGTGPRHVTFSHFNATRAYLYLVSELDNTVRVFILDYAKPCAPATYFEGPKNLTITLQQIISTLGPSADRSAPTNENTAAEIEVTRDQKFAYASNRRNLTPDSDTFAIYSVDAGHSLTYLGWNETLGKIPRHFALSKDDRNQWVAVVHQLTQDVFVFERDPEGGFFTKLRGRIELGDPDKNLTAGPICVLWK